MKIGIDYSLSSPGVCVNTSEGEFKYEDCTFYFLTNTKKYDATFCRPFVLFTRVDFTTGWSVSFLYHNPGGILR